MDFEVILASGKVEDHELVEWRDFYTSSGMTNVRTQQTLGVPKWPIWVPVWIFSNADDQCNLELRIDTIKRKSGQPRYLISSDDLSEHINYAREIHENDAALIARIAAMRDKEQVSSVDSLSEWLAILQIRE